MSVAESVGIKERPILFSGPMVCAILEGRKTQTRRVVTEAYKSRRKSGVKLVPELLAHPLMGVGHACPYGVSGDRLWVRETFAPNPYDDKIFFRATDSMPERSEYGPLAWKPAIHMPRWASRINLEIVSIRVEHVQDISEADAIAEGLTFSERVGFWTSPAGNCAYPELAFRYLWDSINEKRGFGWDLNPWVWVIEFRRVA